MGPTAPKDATTIGLAPGESVDRWRIEEPIGSGGQGEVYRAIEIETGAEVALKVFPAGHFANAQWGRVARELEVGRRVEHPRLIVAVASGRYRGHDLLAMPFISGETLAAMLARRGRLTAGEAGSVVRDVAAGLAHAHSRGVIHRDVSPGNVLVDSDGRAHLMDFGVALILGVPDVPGSPGTLGTPSYRAPELTSAAPGAASSDTFSLGVLAVAMLTGDPRANLEEVEHIPVEARRLLERTLSAHPSARPADVVSFAQGLVTSCGAKPQPPEASVAAPKLRLAAPRPARDPLRPSTEFPKILAARGISLALATGSAERLVLLSSTGDRIESFVRTVGRVDAVVARGDWLVAARDHDLLLFRDVLDSVEHSRDGHDAAYRPQMAYYTGAIDIQDLAMSTDERIFMASRLFSCIAEPAHGHSFRPIWKPPFVRAMAPEETGHLSGLALEGDLPRFVTLMALDGGELRPGSGGLMDISNGASLATGLDHPAMPRAGTDGVWLVEIASGCLTLVTEDGELHRLPLPGLATALALHDDVAFVGLTAPARATDAPEPMGPLAAMTDDYRTGVAVVDLAAREVVANAWFAETVREVSSLAVVSGRNAPMAIGFKTDELRHTISVAEPNWIGSSRA